MRAFRRRRDMTCRQAVELITGYLDGELPTGERRTLERHLRTCPDCAQYLEQIRATVAATRRTDAGLADPDGLSPQTRRALLDVYRQMRDTP